MSQRSKSLGRHSLILLASVSISLTSVLAGCGSARQAARPVEAASLVEPAQPEIAMNAADAAAAQPGSTGQPPDKAPATGASGEAEPGALDSLEDVYSSFTEEREQEERRKAIEEGTLVPETPPPLEYASQITGGFEAAEFALPRWISGGKMVRFLDPIHMVKRGGGYYIVDAGHGSIFFYNEFKKTLLPVINVSKYFVGDPGGMIQTSDGYLFISDPAGKRVLKFNSEYKLVAIFKDAINLAQPQRLYYDETGQRLFVSDGVFSRILVFNALGTPLYSIGERGGELGQFISLTDFLVNDDNIYVTDSVGLRAQVISIEGQPLRSYGQDALVMPLAIAMDQYGRLYIADRDDDLIKVFVDGELRWKIGGSGIAPGRFKEINEMNIVDDHLYVVERINRRIQIFKIVSPEGGNVTQ